MITPGSTNPLLATADAGGYRIERSLRFNRADSAYLNRTPTTAGNRKTWTWSGWVKRSAIGTGTYEVFRGDASTGGTSLFTGIRFIDDQLYIQDANTASYNTWWVTTAVFRDPSAWYHFVVKYDTTQASSSNAVSLWVNGVSQTLTFTFAMGAYVQNRDSYINATNGQYLGAGLTDAGALSANYFSGYITEINFIDGSAKVPGDFGETDTDTGVWKPKAYSGTYGTNGFYLKFADNSGTTSTTLGKDSSGNGNNWTPNNFSVTAGAGNDSLVDTPTPYGTDTGAGGEVRGNYATLNPNRNTASTQGTFSNGNLQIAGTNGVNNCYAAGTMAFAGKMYCEITITAAGGDTTTQGVGIVPITSNQNAVANSMSTGIYYIINGNKRVTGTSSSYGSSYTTGDVIGIAVDVDSETVTFYKNNVSQGSISGTGVISAGVVAYIGFQDGGSPSITANFGQRPFAYTAPSGFKALCTQNLPTPTIGATSATRANKYFDVVLRTSNGSAGGTYSTTVNMSNGALLWDKARSINSSHYLLDSVRGISKTLSSDTTGAEANYPNWFTNFGSSSFTTGSDDYTAGTTVVDWIWAANGSGSTNNAGSIQSTVSANTTAGFSIVTATAQSSGVGTFGHGLGVAPSMVIIKGRGSASSWGVYHVSTGNGGYLLLNSTSAFTTDLNFMNNTSPSSTVFTLGASYAGYGTFVTYCFAPVAGYSAFGSYTGNGSTDGPFVYTGFRPKFVMIKCTTTSYGWVMLDSARNTYNPENLYLYANLSDAEATFVIADFLSNGFKIKAGATTATNDNGQTFAYVAFAEVPTKFSLAR